MKRYFQWLVGDDRGKVVELVDITQEDGEYFFNFDDGESCNMSYICPATNNKKSLVNKAMVEVPGPHNAWKFEEIKMGTFTTAEHEVVDVPPLQDIIGMNGDNSLDKSALGTMNLIPPKSNPILGMPLPDIRDYLRDEPKPRKEVASNVGVTVHDNTIEHAIINNLTEEPKAEPRVFTPPTRQQTADESDPVFILVKTCKKHESSVDLKISLSLPSISTYNFAKSEFEDGDKKFIDAIANSISVETVMDSLKDALRTAYEKGGDA
jgi:hypothetical protein